MRFQAMKIRRTVLIPLIIVVVIIVAASVGGYLLYTNYNYYSTDDAQVTGNVVNIDAMATGPLDTLTVKVGDFVSKYEEGIS